MNRRIAALALAAVALLGLTACTGAPPFGGGTAGPTIGTDAPGDDGQSVSDACDLIATTITEATTEFESAASADPAAIVEAMKSAAQKLADAAGRVTNDEVAALLPDLQAMFDQTSEVMQALVDGDVSKLGDLTELGETFQDTTTRFQELCSP